MRNTVLSLFFLLPLCIFFLFENASSNPIIQWGWKCKTQTSNPLHRYRKTSLKQNKEKDTNNTLKGYSYSSMCQNSSPMLIIRLFASFQGGVHVFLFLMCSFYTVWALQHTHTNAVAYCVHFLYAWIFCQNTFWHLPKCVLHSICNVMNEAKVMIAFIIDIFFKLLQKYD